jgi:superfamily II DNA/RNA helicase
VTGSYFAEELTEAEWAELVPQFGLRKTIRRHAEECLREAMARAPAPGPVPVRPAAATPLPPTMSPVVALQTPRPLLQEVMVDGVPVSMLARTAKPESKLSLRVPTASVWPKSPAVSATLSPRQNAVGIAIDLTGEEALSPSRTPWALAQDAEKNRLFWEKSGVSELVNDGFGWQEGESLREGQRTILELITKGNHAIVKAATGSGKTDLICRMVRMLAAVKDAGIADALEVPDILICVLEPFIVNCENVVQAASVTSAWRGKHASTCYGDSSRGSDLNALTSPDCCLFVSTPEALVAENISTRIENGLLNRRESGCFILYAIDEADSMALDNGFRKVEDAINRIMKCACQTLWLSATGSLNTMRYLQKMIGFSVEVTELGLQGLAARPDIDIRVTPFAPKKDVEKQRSELVTKLLFEDKRRHRCIVFLRHMWSDGQVADEVMQLKMMIMQKDPTMTVMLLHAKLTSHERDRVVQAFNRGNCVILATELIQRWNAIDAHLLIMGVMPTSPEGVVQLIGRVNRMPSEETKAAGISKGLVHILERKEDDYRYFRSFLKENPNGNSNGNGPCKLMGIQVEKFLCFSTKLSSCLSATFLF